MVKILDFAEPSCEESSQQGNVRQTSFDTSALVGPSIVAFGKISEFTVQLYHFFGDDLRYLVDTISDMT
jgi:hypothetical protein